MKKKYIIPILIIIILITMIFILFLNKSKNNSQMIEATILLVADEYLLVTSDNQDYIVYTDELNYNTNDIVAIELTDIKTNKTPYEGNAKKIILIEKNVKQEQSEESQKEDNNNNYNTNSEQNNTHNNQQNNETYQEEINTNTSQEENIITYFEDLNNEVETSNENDETIGQKIKNKFISCIDFIFYDKEINGVKFKDLTNKTKLKIIEITLSIDSKIDSKFPGYKEDINNSYNNIKSKLIETYLNITTDICDKDQNLCEEAKQGFNKIKNGFNITWNFIKDIIGNSASKLKDWYEIWKYQ